MRTDEALVVLRRFKEERGEEYHLTGLGLFGSVARGTATEDSDVDVVFTTDAPNLFRMSRMRQELERCFGCGVDVIGLHDHMNPTLKRRIQGEARYV